MLGFSSLSETPLSSLPVSAAPPGADGGYRSFFGFWFGGLAASVGGATGQPIILRTATVPFLGGSLRRGGW